MNYLQTRKKILVLSLAIVPLVLSAQSDSSGMRRTTRNIAWFIPCGATKINGVAAGLVTLNTRERPMKINGLNLSAGAITVIAWPYVVHYMLSSPKKRKKDFMEADSTGVVINGMNLSVGGEAGLNVNGINIAGFMTGAGTLRGVSVTGVFTKTRDFRGLCISGLTNIATKGKGLQIGLFNSCQDLKGIQLGLWNKSGKRGLPFINWGT